MKKIFIASIAMLIATTTHAAIDTTHKTALTPGQQARLIAHPPKATSKFNMQLNLNANDSVISTTFNPTNIDTFDYVVNGIIYDSLGAMHVVAYYFAKSSVNTWAVYPYVDEVIIGTGSVRFDGAGNVLTTTGMTDLSFSPDNGAISPQIFSTNFSGSTQYAGPSRLKSMDQNGYPYEPDFHSKSAS